MILPKNFLRSLIISSIVGVALYAVTGLATDIQKIQTSAVELGIKGWLIVLALSLLNYSLRFYRWHGYLRQLSYDIPTLFHSVCYVCGFAFTITPGKVGEAVRSLYLKGYNVSYKHSLAAMFAERFVDLTVIVLLSLMFATDYKEGRWAVIVLGILVIAILPLIHSSACYRFLDFTGVKIKSEKIAESVRQISKLIHSSAMLLKSALLYRGVILGLIAWGAEGYGLYVILHYLGVEIAPIIAIGVYAIGILAGAVSFIPGGLGSTEAVMILLLGFHGVETSTAISATLICRIATLWFAVVLGIISLSWLEFFGLKKN